MIHAHLNIRTILFRFLWIPSSRHHLGENPPVPSSAYPPQGLHNLPTLPVQCPLRFGPLPKFANCSSDTTGGLPIPCHWNWKRPVPIEQRHFKITISTRELADLHQFTTGGRCGLQPSLLPLHHSPLLKPPCTTSLQRRKLVECICPDILMRTPRTHLYFLYICALNNILLFLVPYSFLLLLHPIILHCLLV